MGQVKNVEALQVYAKLKVILKLDKVCLKNVAKKFVKKYRKCFYKVF